MNDECKKVIAHINKLQGQLNTLKDYLDKGRACGDVVHMAISSAKSFDSLRAKIVEGFIKQEFLNDSELDAKQAEMFEELKKLIKS